MTYLILFADDTVLCTQSVSFDALEREVNVELTKVYCWLASNKLTLNINKSKFMIVSRRRTIPDLNILLNNVPLQSCVNYKYLGVTFDKDLNWKCHIDNITNKLAKSCGALAKVRHCVDTNTLVSIYYALIHSYIRYGILAWGNASQTTLKPLKTMINKAVRIITFAPFGSLNLEPAYKHLKLLPLNKVFQMEVAKLAYKSHSGLLPVSITNYFQLSSANPNHQYSVRNRRPIRLITNSRIGEKSVQFNYFTIWKNLPSELKNCESFNIFKRALKTYLLESS